MNKEKIINSMERAIYYFIRMYNIPSQDYDDVSQQCKEKILTSIEQYNPQRGTTVNQFLMPRIRGVVKEAVRKDNKKPLPIDEIFIIENSSVEEKLLNQERDKTLQKAIYNLSPMQHKVIVLKYFHYLSMSEIAFVLGIHYSTVAKYHQRGLKALKKQLK